MSTGAPLERRRRCSTRSASCSPPAACPTTPLLVQEADGTWRVQGDPTEAAFLVAEAKLPGVTEARQARFDRVGEIPFTSERKLMTTLQADVEREGRIAVVTKGAPDVLLARCTHERIAGEVVELDDAAARRGAGSRRSPRRPRPAHARRGATVRCRHTEPPIDTEVMRRS